jgi:hypothetical protein
MGQSWPSEQLGSSETIMRNGEQEMIILVIAIAVCIVLALVFVAIVYLDDSISEPDEHEDFKDMRG